MNGNGIRLAKFQVKLVFNHVPSGLKYNGADLTGEILSTLTEEQAREAIRLASHKLPIKSKFAIKGQEVKGGEA